MRSGIILIFIFIVCIGIGNYIYKINQISSTEFKQKAQISDEKITDECTKEGEELALANSTEKKVSPNATFIFKTKYKKCGHMIEEDITATELDVNKTEDEIKSLYNRWNLISFSNNEIVFERELDEMCKEHYVLRNANGEIAVYYVDEEANEIFYQNTGILIQYLPEADKQNIENGIFVIGKEKLNKMIEDFE